MSGGDAFVIQAATEIAVREHVLNERRQRGRPPDPGRGLRKRTVAEVVVAIVASAVISLMVAAGGLSDLAVTDEACPVGQEAICAPPDVLTICRNDGGRLQCVKEPT
jgi:hypothetical protein